MNTYRVRIEQLQRRVYEVEAASEYKAEGEALNKHHTDTYRWGTSYIAEFDEKPVLVSISNEEDV